MFDSSGRELVDVGGASLNVDLGSVTIEDATTHSQQAHVDTHGSIFVTEKDTSGSDAVGAKTTAAAMPAGGSGKLGWLSAIATYLAGVLSTNVSQVNGTTTDTNSGSKSAGTQRVVLATDQPALTNAQPTAQANQKSTLVQPCNAVTTVSTSAAQNMDGYNGLQMLEAIAVGTVAAQTCTFAVEGSFDSSNWYTAGIQQLASAAAPGNGVSAPARALAATITPGNATIRQVFQILDAYKFVRINLTANTLATGFYANIYAEPI